MTGYDPLDPEQHRDPWAVMERARAECPVGRFGPGASYVASYGPAVEALRDVERLSSKDNFLAQPLPEGIPPFVTQLDPPRHAHLRKLLRGLFTRSRVVAAAPMMLATARALLDEAEPAGVVDVAAFGRAYASRVLYSMIGAPEKEWDRLNELVYALLQVFPGPYWETGLFAQWEEYVAGLTAMRRAEPADDFLTVLIRDGGFDDREIGQHVMQLVVAGHETTATLIANLAYQLLLEPERWARVRADRTLVRAAVEESLRHLAPISWVSRTATGGGDFPAGEMVLVSLESANRDAAVFPEPGAYDLDRPNAAKHLAFGASAHRCLGDGLATQEAEVALGELLDRYAAPRLVDRVYETMPSVLLRSPARMRIEV